MGTKYSNTVFDRQKFVYRHGQRSVIDIDSEDQSELKSQWYKKYRFISQDIGPCGNSTYAEPLTLRNNDGSNTAPGVGSLVSVLTTGKEYYFRIGLKFNSGRLGRQPNQQISYNGGGLIGDPLNQGGCAGVGANGMSMGYAERQGRVYLKTASSGSQDIIINVNGPGFYDVKFTPIAGANQYLQISTDINGLIIESVKLYNVTDSTYVVDNMVRNGNFTFSHNYASSMFNKA